MSEGDSANIWFKLQRSANPKCLLSPHLFASR